MTRAQSAPNDQRSTAFARLFEAVHEGVFIGTLAPDGDGPTLAVNPHLKRMFGLGAETPDAEVEPFASARFADHELVATTRR